MYNPVILLISIYQEKWKLYTYKNLCVNVYREAIRNHQNLEVSNVFQLVNGEINGTAIQWNDTQQSEEMKC